MEQVIEFSPVSLADSLKESLVTKRDKKERSALGQYMTPPVISQFMASLFQDLSGKQIRLLDPGSGMGTLSASVCREILTRKCKRNFGSNTPWYCNNGSSDDLRTKAGHKLNANFDQPYHDRGNLF